MTETLTGAQLMGIIPPDPAIPPIPDSPDIPLSVSPDETGVFAAETTPAHEIMIDTTHANVSHIPAATKKIAGYDTGSPDIDWTADDWARFPDAGHVVIDQSAGLAQYAIGKANVADVETGAGTIPEFVKGTQDRISRGQDGWIYGAQATVVYTAGQLTRAGVDLRRVGAWIADWNLSEAEASALLGTSIGGIRVVAVQWASPTSNPATVVPGGSQTLREANVDLSVAEAGWFPPERPPAAVVTVQDAKAAITEIWKALDGLEGEFTVLEEFASQK